VKIHKILLILFGFSPITLSIVGCSQKQISTHLGTGAGAVAGYTTCAGLLDTNMPLTALCTVVGAVWGSTMFYKNDMNTHTAIFVDTLNTAPGKRSHTNWGNSANGNWGSITINRTYVNHSFRCRDYESVISIEQSWPMNGISRESETGTACQLPDGRWKITESTNT
jgi:surface antigen